MIPEESTSALYRGMYDPRRLYIHLNQAPNDILAEDATLHPATATGWGLLIHEYFHYLQNISSPVGVTLFNNWISIQTDIARIFDRTTNLTFLLENIADSEGVTCLSGVKTFFEESRMVYGTDKPLLASSRQLDSAWEHFDRSIVYPGSTRTIPLKHILVPTESQCFEVPLIPVAFAEGMSKMIQWYIETNGNWHDNLLEEYPVRSPEIYYSVIARSVRHHFPSANPFWLTVAICDACLCSSDPGHAFDMTIRFLLENKPVFESETDYLVLRRKLHLLPPFRTELTRALARINDLDLHLSPASPNEAAFDMRRIISRIKSALLARLTEPEHFVFLGAPEDILNHFRDIYGSPAISVGRTKAEKIFIGPAEDPDYMRACLLLMTIYHIVETALCKPQIGVCPYYPIQCKAEKKGAYCTENPLWAPTIDGHGCIMAYAAQTLCASGKGPRPGARFHTR